LSQFARQRLLRLHVTFPAPPAPIRSVIPPQSLSPLQRNHSFDNSRARKPAFCHQDEKSRGTIHG
jgi:hypothetical protein